MLAQAWHQSMHDDRWTMMTTETTARTVNHGIAGPTERNTVDCGKVRTASMKSLTRSMLLKVLHRTIIILLHDIDIDRRLGILTFPEHAGRRTLSASFKAGAGLSRSSFNNQTQ
jgi:hypothetical protein